MPVKNGCSPEVPGGGHSTHAGAPLAGAVAALPEDPPEPPREGAVTVAPPAALDRLPEAPPADAAPPVGPAAEPPIWLVVLFVEGAAPAGLPWPAGATVEAEEPASTVTAPLSVTLPGGAAVCAIAGAATAKAASNIPQSRGVIPIG